MERIFLVGYMYSGKSTVGRCLAQRLGWRFVDLDGAFEEKYRISISRFFEKYGEDLFRRLEHELLQEVVGDTHVVVATGGGTPCYYGNMALLLQQGFCIYLRASADDVVARLQHSPRLWRRPLLAGLDSEQMVTFVRQQLEQREATYLQASLVCPVGGRSVDLIVGDILAKCQQ